MKLKMAPNSVFAILLRKPWWISFVLASVFVLVAFALLPDDLRVVGSLGAIPFFVISGVAFVRQWNAPSEREVQALTQAVSVMGWSDFSKALTQAYTAQGHAVRAIEGGADLRLEREGRIALVAARRWKAAHYLALGELTPGAQRLMRQNGLHSVQATQLAQLLRGVVASGR